MQGLVLTDTTNLAGMLSAMRSNGIPLLKVVTGWGYAWTDESRAQLLSLPQLIVRTINGDGTRPSPSSDGKIFLEPSAVMDELLPWLSMAPSLWVELGNEPNATDPSDDAAWTFRYWYLETVEALRARWPCARLVAPGLISNRQENWWAINADAFALSDAIGFHAYAWHDFIPGDTGQIENALGQLGRYFPELPWIGSELGINDAATSPNTKADRYKKLHAKLPSQVLMACWYHQVDRPSNADQHAYQLPQSAWPHLGARGSVR